AAGAGAQVFRQPTVEARGLGGEKSDERVVSCLADCRMKRDRPFRSMHPAETLVAGFDGNDRVEHRDVDDSERPARPARSKLLRIVPGLARSRRCMIEATGIDGDLIPAPNCIEITPRLRLGIG